MKCSSRRNCNRRIFEASFRAEISLNEVQLPKELQHGPPCGLRPTKKSLNEVQLPKELQPVRLV